MFKNPFSDIELHQRLDRVRQELAIRELDIGVFSAPESVFYLTGLDHWGYFVPHHLVVPLEGDMVLVTRQMERVTIEHQVRNARFIGHTDSETAAATLARWLTVEADRRGRPVSKGGAHRLRVGLECSSSGLSDAAGQILRQDAPQILYQDISGLSDRLRLVKSEEEMVLMRRAAIASDAAMQAAIDTLEAGVSEAEVAAASLSAMTRAGGHPPGFGPFIRPEKRLNEEHTSWGDGIYREGERVFLEMAGCISRYHAPQGRLIHLGRLSEADTRMAETCSAAFNAVCDALKPGALAREVYGAWQDVVDAAGLANYRRHHCGYLVGIGFPPSWTGGNKVTGLLAESDLIIETGMSFHILSWLMGTGKGDFFLSNCVLLGPEGCEVLTRTPHGPAVRRGEAA